MNHVLLTAVILTAGLAASAQKPDATLRFNEPAAHYQESLPLGNGKIGAMITGHPVKDRIMLNEISLWSGGVQDADSDTAYRILPRIRESLLAGRNKEAQDLLQQYFICKGEGSGHGNGANVPYGAYQTLGDLTLRWKDTLSSWTAYRRSLDLESAVARTTWQRNGIVYTQEAWTSIPDNILAIRIKGSRKGGISFTAALSRSATT